LINIVEYRGLLAQTWDLLRGDTSAWPDRAFYRTLIELGKDRHLMSDAEQVA
jgi:hypothetical protein